MKHATGSGGGVRSRMAKKWLPQSRWPYDLVLLVLFCGVTGSCPLGERMLLMTCLEPLRYLQDNHNYPSQKACNLTINLIHCVEQRLFRCHGSVEVHDALNIADSLKAEYCNVEASEKRSTPTTVATTVTTVIPQTTITLTTRPSVADEDDSEIDHKFQLCRDKFTKHEPKTLEEGCRLAEAFLDCGYAVLQAYKVSLDTLYLHAELLRNSAIYWEYCGDDRSSKYFPKR
ncbi:hypothetical protein C0Q70_20990 [Pomacea canaliculata]|uniref:Uncharacterized protein n=1 Tax=Pomacea canaliculata TaxID=400727 RepID=A0A2T7NBA2_POMCA|nr:hypothetical protein C0Q70_20990 [Pomacea canaliculata]